MLLLDTHALIWLATDLPQLTETAKSAIRYHAQELHVSAISALEISLLTKCEKLDWGKRPLSRFERALEHHCVKTVPIDAGIAWQSGQLPHIHRDPFDRIIIASAMAHGMTILTKDRTIPTYPKVKVVWE
ncbi:Ribonuclease VapC22 [Pontiella desulfatans]|uniref:Ribonuclease VapC22 n=1 Tax=Pontiella desulfatans TaxID=2750659 RepID=A0A6C2TVV5_PONDE|nr:type II toxin-antitoxin system VapC family toxin [Pontiella desulfatans]VGO11798.1 Ribonuclease VapC22 [Pontiella desulfatans]